MWYGVASSANEAGPPSPLYEAIPLPAMVLMMPLAETKRTRLFDESAMKKPPPGATATPEGAKMDASVAGPPSPLKASLPSPAMVVMICKARQRRHKWSGVCVGGVRAKYKHGTLSSEQLVRRSVPQ